MFHRGWVVSTHAFCGINVCMRRRQFIVCFPTRLLIFARIEGTPRRVPFCGVRFPYDKPEDGNPLTGIGD